MGDARAVRIRAPKNVNLSGDGTDTGRLEVVAENEGDHLETVGIYLDIVAPPDGGCLPGGRLRGTSISLGPGDRRTLTIDGYPGDPVPGDGFVTFSCADPLAADALNYTILVAVDAHADDTAACPPGAIQSISCFSALGDDDSDPADNRLARAGPIVR